MSAPVRPRAVVFTLVDLPEGDRAQLHEVAAHLRLPADPGSDRIALALLPGTAQLQLPGLLSDGDVARGGPSLLLLAMRLLLADLYSWPEVRDVLGSADTADAEAGYALYAADPDRFTVEGLMAALAPHCAEVRKGLLPRGPRPPAAPGDRVPVLGWQVPVLGSREPVARLRDLRPAEQRPHRFCGQDLPLGVVPGGESGRHRLYLRVLSTAQRGERGHADVEVLLGDSASGRLRAGRIGVVVRDLAHLGQLPDGPVDPEDDEGLAEVLREVLPVCLQPIPSGDLLLCDLFGLGLGLAKEAPVSADGGGVTLEVVSRLTLTEAGVEVRAVPGPCARGGEEEWAELLDPSLWGLSTLCALLAPEDVRVAEGGRYAALRLNGRRDGQPVDGVLVLEMDAQRGARAVAWPMDLDGPAPGLALAGGWLALAGGRGGAPLGLGCLGAAGVELAGGVLLCQLPDMRIGARLPLPPPMTMATASQAGPPQLYPLPGGDAILCQQPGGRLLCVIDAVSAGAPLVRPARPEDLRALLLSEGGGPLRQLLHGLGGPGPLEDVPALGFLGMGGELQRRLRREAAGLLTRPVEEAADAVLRLWLQVERPQTFAEDQVRGLA